MRERSLGGAMRVVAIVKARDGGSGLGGDGLVTWRPTCATCGCAILMFIADDD